MNMMTMNADSLSKAIGETVPDIYVVIAKNSIVGMEASQIGDLLGATREEIDEITGLEIYKNIRLLLASEYAKTRVDADFSWDDLESTALKGLSKRMAFENDPDFLLKVAAVANKAQRRFGDKGQIVLDPAQGTVRVPLNLTSRIVKRLNQRTGEQSVEETRSVSLQDGTAVNPSFEDIDKMFGVSVRPMVAERATTRTVEADFSVDDLAEQWLKGNH